MTEGPHLSRCGPSVLSRPPVSLLLTGRAAAKAAPQAPDAALEGAWQHGAFASARLAVPALHARVPAS